MRVYNSGWEKLGIGYMGLRLGRVGGGFVRFIVVEWVYVFFGVVI